MTDSNYERDYNFGFDSELFDPVERAARLARVRWPLRPAEARRLRKAAALLRDLAGRRAGQLLCPFCASPYPEARR